MSQFSRQFVNFFALFLFLVSVLCPRLTFAGYLSDSHGYGLNDAREYDSWQYPTGRGTSSYSSGKGARMFAVAGDEFHPSAR
ncbi:hypothetical protein ANTQUA_LOCUS2086 [Anthophora quadrimaculata]